MSDKSDVVADVECSILSALMRSPSLLLYLYGRAAFQVRIEVYLDPDKTLFSALWFMAFE